MIKRFSSRREKLDTSFINKRLISAVSYDRIAGYFRSSMLEVAGEKLENMDGNVRVVCNSDIESEDAKTAKAAQQALRRSWCEGNPEKFGESSKDRFSRLYQFIKSGKLEIRVLPDEAFGLIHGKAGIIQYNNGTQTCFMGSANESFSACEVRCRVLISALADISLRRYIEKTCQGHGELSLKIQFRNSNLLGFPKMT